MYTKPWKWDYVQLGFRSRCFNISNICLGLYLSLGTSVIQHEMRLRTKFKLCDLQTESIHVKSTTKEWLELGMSVRRYIYNQLSIIFVLCVVAATGNLLKYFSHLSLTQKGLSVIFSGCSFHTIPVLKNTKGIRILHIASTLALIKPVVQFV